MNIKQLKNKAFVDFASKIVGYRVEKLFPILTRASGVVVLDFTAPDNGYGQTEYEKFMFSSTSCVRKSNMVGTIDISNRWLEFVNNLQTEKENKNITSI